MRQTERVRGNRPRVGIWLSAGTLVLLVLRLAVGIRAGQGSSVLLGLVLAGIVICAVGVVVPAISTRQLSRIRSLGGRDVLVWRVIDPQNTLASRFLSVSRSDGWARLTDKHGDLLAEWTTETYAGVEQKPVCAAGSVVSHLGLSLRAVNGSAVDILLPSRTTLTYPPRIRSEVTRALADAFNRR